MSVYKQSKKGGKPYYLAKEGQQSPYQLTVQRLYALPILRERILDNEAELMELESLGIEALRGHDRSIVRLLRPGMRVSEEEAHLAQMASLRGRIAADELEVNRIQRALNCICGDPYFAVIDHKYFQRLTDDESAEIMNCDPSTVRRNRLRLVKRIALRLYGTEAL